MKQNKIPIVIYSGLWVLYGIERERTFSQPCLTLVHVMCHVHEGPQKSVFAVCDMSFLMLCFQVRMLCSSALGIVCWTTPSWATMPASLPTARQVGLDIMPLGYINRSIVKLCRCYANRSVITAVGYVKLAKPKALSHNSHAIRVNMSTLLIKVPPFYMEICFHDSMNDSSASQTECSTFNVHFTSAAEPCCARHSLFN